MKQVPLPSATGMGAGQRGADQSVAPRLAALRMRRDNVQIAGSIPWVGDDGSVEVVDFTGNGAEGFNRGIEVQAG